MLSLQQFAAAIQCTLLTAEPWHGPSARQVLTGVTAWLNCA